MDVEFHYYITYLLAARAGFTPSDARVIAYACQAVDDNNLRCRISDGAGNYYENPLSQTMDITKPDVELYKIYPVFHFVPWCGIKEKGITSPSPRTDGEETNKENTSPNNLLAQKMLKNAFDLPETADERLYRIGIAAHAYADTWAHQNFLGRQSKLNSIPTNTCPDPRIPTSTTEYCVENIINTGHGAFEHKPDIPNLIWEDTRLVEPRIDNRARFLDAAAHLFTAFLEDRSPRKSPKAIRKEVEEIVENLDKDIGSKKSSKGSRIRSYCKRALAPEYGGTELPQYGEENLLWPKEAIQETWTGLINEVREHLCVQAGGVFQRNPIDCRWLKPLEYKKSDWYKFLESVRQHQEAGSAILKEHGIIPTRTRAEG